MLKKDFAANVYRHTHTDDIIDLAKRITRFYSIKDCEEGHKDIQNLLESDIC